MYSTTPISTSRTGSGPAPPHRGLFHPLSFRPIGARYRVVSHRWTAHELPEVRTPLAGFRVEAGTFRHAVPDLRSAHCQTLSSDVSTRHLSPKTLCPQRPLRMDPYTCSTSTETVLARLDGGEDLSLGLSPSCIQAAAKTRRHCTHSDSGACPTLTCTCGEWGEGTRDTAFFSPAFLHNLARQATTLTHFLEHKSCDGRNPCAPGV